MRDVKVTRSNAELPFVRIVAIEVHRLPWCQRMAWVHIVESGWHREVGVRRVSSWKSIAIVKRNAFNIGQIYFGLSVRDGCMTCSMREHGQSRRQFSPNYNLRLRESVGS